MIGMIYLEQEAADKAVVAYERALGAQKRSPEQEQSLLYDLGSAYEMLSEVALALKSFERLLAMSSDYRDVRERVAALSGTNQPTSQARAVGGDEEFDTALNDLFDGK
jgi:tetratricopeptide (TPR) repeat protein